MKTAIKSKSKLFIRCVNDFRKVLIDEGLYAAVTKSIQVINKEIFKSHDDDGETVKSAEQVERFNPYDYLHLLKEIDITVVDKDIKIDKGITFSLITTIKNEAQNIKQFLTSLQEQSLIPDEVIIVDGGSSDSTVTIIEQLIKNIPYVRFIKGEGLNIAQGRNLGIRNSNNEVIVFADAGCRLDRDYCKNLIGCFYAFGETDLVGGIYYPNKPFDYCKDWWNWENNDWKSFLPSARSLAVRKPLALKAGLFPEYLTLTGEDTLFDIAYRRVSRKWVFNKKAIVYWHAPETKGDADKLWFKYMRGDGESGLGDFRFYPLLNRAKKDTQEDLRSMGKGFLKKGFSGYLEGRSKRSEIEIAKRGIKGLFIILTGVPLTDSGGGQRGAQLAFELIRNNYKVVLVNVYPSYEEKKKFFFDIDYSLLELYSFDDFDFKEIVMRYKGFLDKTVLLMEFPIPDFIPIIDYLKSCNKNIKVIYDYIDNWNSSLGGTWYNEPKEMEVVSKSDILLAAAKTLQNNLEQRSGRDVTLVPNAFNSHLFNFDAKYEYPEDLPMGKPIVLYVGAMWGEWFDWDLIEYSARNLIEFDFVLVGNVAEWRRDHYKAYQNIFFLGLKRQSELPAYLQYSNACIIPFKIDNITVFVNPLKVYEYLAMRKPVISTDIAELRNIPGVMIATDSDDFICNIRKAIEHTHSFDGIEEYLKLNNWGSRVKKIEDLLSGIESKTLDISDIQGSEDRSVRPKRSLDFNDKYAAYLRILQEVQEEITSLTTCPFYADFQKGKDYCGKEVCFPPYRDAEIYYWENIPKWIYEDSKSNTIRNCLDIGCSYGTLSLFTKKVAGCDSFLIDFIDVYISSKLVDKYNFNFFVNNIELDEFPVKLRFDAIIFTEILEHLNFHPVPTLKKLRALLNDNGRIYMSTPDAAEHGKVQEFYNSYKEMPCPKKGSKVIDTHIYQYNKEELFSIIDEADFKIERFDYARGLGARHFNLILQKK